MAPAVVNRPRRVRPPDPGNEAAAPRLAPRNGGELGIPGRSSDPHNSRDPNVLQAAWLATRYRLTAERAALVASLAFWGRFG